MKKNIRAFSLIEISVVILIVSLIMAMIIKSNSYFYESRLKAAISLTQGSPVKNVDGLLLWLETTTPESFDYSQANDGSHITTWRDINPQIAIKNNLTRGTSNSKIKYVDNAVGGLPSVYFDGSNTTSSFLLGDLLKITNKSFSFFVVSKSLDATSTTYRVVFFNGNDSLSSGWGYQKRNPATKSRNLTLKGVVDMEGSQISSETEIISGVYDGVNSLGYLYLNGSSQTLSSSSGAANFSNSGGFYLGSWSSAGVSSWSGYISEIIIFNDAISSDDRKEIEKYLSQKYRISVS